MIDEIQELYIHFIMMNIELIYRSILIDNYYCYNNNDNDKNKLVIINELTSIVDELIDIIA
jgi:hypothetical protein